MWRAFGTFPQQLSDGLAAGSAVRTATPATILLAGMGGSGIGGALAAGWLAQRASVPLVPWPEETPPGHLGWEDLVLAVSYSGETGETLAVARAALQRRARVVAITTGGSLASMVQEAGHPVVRVPAGMQPRSALGFLFGAVVGVLGSAVAPGAHDELARAVKALEPLPRQLREDERAPAHILASQLGAEQVHVVGHDLMALAARRFATQLDENAKVVAAFHALPEGMHNVVVPLAAGAPDARLVLLRRANESPLEAARFDHVRSEARVGQVVEVRVPGEGVEQLLRAVLIGDAASLLLAERLGRDPEEVATIGRLKERLRRLGSG